MKKNLLLVAALFAGIASYAQCEAVATLNEDFSDFTITTASAQAFPQQCWSSIGAAQSGPWIYTAQKNEPVDKYVVYYTHLQGANVPGYVISPELSTIDGEHQLSFDTYKLGGGPGGEIPPGNITVQIGLISDPASTADFTEVGTAFTVNAEATTYTVTIPASATKKYIAFKLLSDSATSAAALDNVVYKDLCPALATLDENFTEVEGLADICWSTITDGAMFFMTGGDDNSVTFYASGAANTDSFLISPEISTLDGNYSLSFDSDRVVMDGGPAPGVVTVQIGTFSDKNDPATFVASGEPITIADEPINHTGIAITAAEGQKYIGFKIVGNIPHTAALIDNVTWTENPVVCEAVTTLDENFSDVEELADICWSTITNGAMFFMTEGEDNSVTFYASGAANTDSFLISRELTTFGENYSLSFDTDRVVMGAGPAPGVVTVQVGTLSDNTDAATFVASGEPITIADEPISHTGIAIAAAEGQKYIAFKIIGNIPHTAALIDNVKWLPTAGIDDLNKNTFSIFPNPTADKNITINHNLEGNGTISVFSLTGAKVFSTALNAASQNVNLASLSAGMYIVKIESGNYTASKKLVIQ